MKQTLRSSVLIAAGLGMIAFGGLQMPAGEAATAKEPAVLELFTSQGCSSCPPADALLGRLARQKGVIALSYSVDYWDYLGWHDTLASPANSARQRAYARARGDGQVYTPQIVINGMRHAVGSNGAAIETAIGSTERTLAGRQVPVHLSRDKDALKITVDAAPAGSKMRSARLLVATMTKDVSVPIGRGENAGRRIAYHNVVRSLRSVGTWTGAAMTVRVPLKSVQRSDGDRYAVLLQEAGPGPILGAAETAAR